MKKMLWFLLSGFLFINLQAQKPKVIIDADTWNEIDDIPAIVNGLKSDKIDVLALTAAHWDRFELCGRQTMYENWLANNKILQLLNKEQIPSLKGARFAMWQGQHYGVKGWDHNKATDFIIKTALEMPEGEKLKVIVTGSATNVASAVISEPKIIDKIAIYFLGFLYDFDTKAWNKNDFNVRSDLHAIDVLLNTENLEFHIMPSNISKQLIITRKDIDSRLNMKVGIDKMLKERWYEFNEDHVDWIMWDIAAVQALINPELANEILVKTPPENKQREVYMYNYINAEAMMEDFWKVYLK
jgi:inosine-uridine nucleoside N-ribohydrolase